MTDAHCHVRGGERRHFICGEAGVGDVAFCGVHPWDAREDTDVSWLDAKLAADTTAQVGEIGLDRLREREISPAMLRVFKEQLEIAAKRSRAVVLHGAKCWGKVVEICKPYRGRIPAFLFHGFSRSDGLIPDIVALNGYISVGPAVLNDHAVNYRKLIRKIPLDRLLVESDRTAESADECPSVEAVAAKTAEILGMEAGELETRLEANATAFLHGGSDD